MHAVGLHSALAIKRQRKRRDEQKRARERRYSSQSTESGLGESRSSCASPRNSTGSLERRRSRRGYRKAKHVDGDKVVSSVGMLHIGVVFLVLGLFLLGSGLMPDDLDDWGKNYKWFNELFVSGLGAIILGVFFIILNKIIAKKEEEDLAEYVQRQLTRSKSGHRLVRDVETGCLTTKSESKSREEKMSEADLNDIPPVHFSPTLKSPPPLSVSTPRSDLERILEEEISEKDEAAMIGAMPAVAVRHERRRQEKRNKRPSLLYLQSPHSRSATPSPLQSPPASHQFPPELYVCGKVSVLHIVVVSLLLGAVLLIVGLFQLKPGADASQHRYVLLGSGGFMLVVGVVLAIVRCCLLPWKQRQELDVEASHLQTRRESITQSKRDSIAHGRASISESQQITASIQNEPPKETRPS